MKRVESIKICQVIHRYKLSQCLYDRELIYLQDITLKFFFLNFFFFSWQFVFSFLNLFLRLSLVYIENLQLLQLFPLFHPPLNYGVIKATQVSIRNNQKAKQMKKVFASLCATKKSWKFKLLLNILALSATSVKHPNLMKAQRKLTYWQKIDLTFSCLKLFFLLLKLIVFATLNTAVKDRSHNQILIFFQAFSKLIAKLRISLWKICRILKNTIEQSTLLFLFLSLYLSFSYSL